MTTADASGDNDDGQIIQPHHTNSEEDKLKRSDIAINLMYLLYILKTASKYTVYRLDEITTVSKKDFIVHSHNAASLHASDSSITVQA